MIDSSSTNDGNRHLRPFGYYALASISAAIGLCASYVTIQSLAVSINASEPDGSARDMLQSIAALFVVAELAAFFIVGLLPARRLRSLRWQLTACAIALVSIEAVSIYGARVALVQSADARAEASTGRAAQLRTSIEASRSSAAALLAAGQKSSQSVIAASRADGAQSIRQATQLEADIRRMTDELAKAEAERKPTTSSVFGQSGVIALAVAQSVLVSCIGLLFLGAAGALARAARDARVDAPAPLHVTTQTDAPPMQTTAPRRAPVTVEQSQAAPAGIPAALPSWGRYALPAAVAAGAGLGACGAATAAVSGAAPMHHAAQTVAPTGAQMQDDTRPAVFDAASDAVHVNDSDRFQRVKTGILSGRIKPSLRAIYAAEGASQPVAQRYLAELERSGVIRRTGRGYASCAGASSLEA